MREAPSPPASATAEGIFRSGRILKLWVWALTGIFVLIALLLTAALVFEQRRSALERARFEASNLSAAFELEVRGFVGNTRAAMKTIEAGIAAKGPKLALSDWFLHRGPDARLTHMTILDVNGKVVSSTVDPNWTGADLSDRAHFKIHAANPHAGLYIGAPILTRGSHRIKFPLSIAIREADGSFRGTVFATVEPEFLRLFYHSLDLGQTGSLMLVSTDGAVLAYLSRHSDAGGKEATANEDGSADGSEIPALHAAASDSKGAYEGRSPVDGIVRLYNWRKIEGHPLIVIVGLGKAEALSASIWQRSVIVAGFSLALLFALSMPYLLGREISKRISNEIELNHEKANLTLANAALDEERKNLHALNAQLRQAKQEAEDASSAKSVFLAYMSHEFRTPMHAILAYTKLALEDLVDGDVNKVKKFIENAQTAEQRLLGLLNNLLDYAKLDAGKVELRAEKTCLLEIIKGSQRELNSLLEQKKLSVSVDPKTSDTRATLDSTRMTQVIVNLFSNAIKFSPLGGNIQVEISDSELADGCPALQCSMSNQGVGIPEKELIKIFERFSQSSATKKSGGGTGLGLTICRELIGLHGGKIWAANQPGGGAVFSFAIPRKPSIKAPASPCNQAQIAA